MILADKIIEERKRNGWSQEELAEKLNVSRQAVSKWESRNSIPDLQKVIQMANIFGVSTDYLLRDEIGEESHIFNEEDSIYRKVTMEEANEFLDLKERNSILVSLGVMLCIISPTILIILSGFSEDNIFNISENLAAGIGCAFLFILIAYAVYLFITCNIKSEKFEYLEKELFETEYGITGMVKEKKKAFEGIFIRSIALGVVLCIVAVVPLVIAATLELQDYIICIFTSLLLLLISFGVRLILKAAIIKDSYDTLLEEGDFTRQEKKDNKKLNLLSSIYWGLITAIYLAISFITFKWHITWIVWPVSGVLFSVVISIAKMIINKEK